MIGLICPKCENQKLYKTEKSYLCKSCNNNYPIIKGIPDFRIEPENEFRLDGPQSTNVDLVNFLVENFNKKDYKGLVNAYYSNFPKLKKDLKKLFRGYRLNVKQFSLHLKNKISNNIKKIRIIKGHNNLYLDIGCGVGGLLLAYSTEYSMVVGIDPSMEDLILAKKLLDENNISNYKLICAHIENFPLKRKEYDFITLHHVIEHVKDQKICIQNISRLLNKGAIAYFISPNRYCIFLLETHTMIPLLGFVPRAYQDAVSTKLRNIELTKTARILGYFEFKQLFKRLETSDILPFHRIRILKPLSWLYNYFKSEHHLLLIK